MALPPLPRCLILDYYDSYTNNLLTLFTRLYSDEEVLKKVVVVNADRYSWNDFQRDVVPQVDCIILSPGPGRPDRPSDIGFALDLIRQHPLPILGICLGFQAIGVAFGAKIINTPQITHGHVIRVAPTSPRLGLFTHRDGEPVQGDFEAVVYNSLVVDESTLSSELEITAYSQPKSGPPTVMGLRHREYPICGVQYHPESISSTQGTSLLANYLDQVHRCHSHPCSYPQLAQEILDSCAYRIGSASSRIKRKPTKIPRITSLPTPPSTPSSSANSPGTSRPNSPGHPVSHLRLAERSFGDFGRDLNTADVFESVIRKRNKGKGRAVGEVWLDGESPTRPTTTSLAAPSFLVTYSLGTRCMILHLPSQESIHTGLKDGETFWDWFDNAQRALSTSQSNGQGFRGGWIGWFGYEMKEESLQGYKSQSQASDQVDACWSWSDWILERSPSGEWTLRGVLRDTPSGNLDRDNGIGALLNQTSISVGLEEGEFQDLYNELRSLMESPSSVAMPSAPRLTFRPAIVGDTYRQRIEDCRESIRQGDSYELTLTTSFQSTLPPQFTPFELYLRLRAHNPAYYSTYVSFPSIPTPKGRGIHILSSSPERFLKIEHGNGRRIEMMPIKGTRKRVPRGSCVCTSSTGCQQKAVGTEACEEERIRVDTRIGQELQEDLKERAENLMIVDLIRSDLLSCCIPSTVTVPKLIALESYGVHNLVTTVQGYLGEDVSSVDAVKRCFPPGSMTGAPKLRSVQLLENYESGRRGIYSGALGYISADGAADLSVVIRTIVVEGSRMSLGAGGAITWMSNADAEWDEVLVKVQSVIRGF